MEIHSRELCPHCIEIIEVNEQMRTIREDARCLVEKTTRFCQSCHQELGSTVTFRFKVK